MSLGGGLTTTALLVAMLTFPTTVVAETLVTIRNESTAVLVAINSFPVGKDGDVIDDNIGGLEEDEVVPGGTGHVVHSGDCGLVEMYLRYASDRDDDEDQVFRVDTCQSRRFVLSDAQR